MENHPAPSTSQCSTCGLRYRDEHAEKTCKRRRRQVVATAEVTGKCALCDTELSVKDDVYTCDQCGWGYSDEEAAS
jgi:rubredoxin